MALRFSAGRSAESVLLEFIGFYFLAPFPPLQDDFILTGVPSTRVVPVRDRLCAKPREARVSDGNSPGSGFFQLGTTVFHQSDLR